MACSGGEEETRESRSSSAEDRIEPFFVERTSEVGINFVHLNSASPAHFMPEIVGAGGALFDYDGDGDLDVLLVQGAPIESGSESAPSQLPASKLFRSELVPSGRLSFVDTTVDAGLDHSGVGMGAAVADYDGDGKLDIYLSSYGANRLLRNTGLGKFQDVTRVAGADDERWTTSSSFLDYDRDGHLDLIAVNYVDFRPTQNRDCRKPSGRPDYCGPQVYRGEPDRLFRNQGDGTFEDATERAGLITEYGASLGVISADFDGDGWQDIFIANDQQPNTLWMNQRNGTFSNEAFPSGTAVNAEGSSEASMGVAVADYDDDGDLDLFLTHLDQQTNTLYVNEGNAQFSDRTSAAGLAAVSRAFTGFGAAFLDYDNDGILDLVVTNGAVFTMEHLAAQGHPWPFSQRDQLFRGSRQGHFMDVTAAAGVAFEQTFVGRGLADGDIDNDGDSDLLITNNGGPARLLINQVGHRSRWIGVSLQKEPGVDDLGAVASLLLSDGRILRRRSHTDGSYLSASDPRLVFGLGEPGAPVRLSVRWVSGRHEHWRPPAIGSYTTIVEGTGEKSDGAED